MRSRDVKEGISYLLTVVPVVLGVVVLHVHGAGVRRPVGVRALVVRLAPAVVGEVDDAHLFRLDELLEQGELRLLDSGEVVLLTVLEVHSEVEVAGGGRVAAVPLELDVLDLVEPDDEGGPVEPDELQRSGERSEEQEAAEELAAR